jgi:uncharacterized repeat protein (TIGR01451 family)
MFYRHTIIAGLAALIGLPTFAQGVAATQTIEKQIVTVADDGTEVIDYIAADMVAPGDTVRYVLSFRNQGEDAAQSVVLVMPVPDETAFIPGSAAHDGVDAGFSYDGSQTFGPEMAGEDAEDPSHIRWIMIDDLAPGAEGQVSFEAVLE